MMMKNAAYTAALPHMGTVACRPPPESTFTATAQINVFTAVPLRAEWAANTALPETIKNELPRSKLETSLLAGILNVALV
jgi:hypothetical protein